MSQHVLDKARRTSYVKASKFGRTALAPSDFIAQADEFPPKIENRRWFRAAEPRL